MIEQESDSDEDASESQSSERSEKEPVRDKAGGKTAKRSDDGSLNSDEGILNRSLDSDEDRAIDVGNYVRYCSDNLIQKQDFLQIVDKNERSFKQVAEKMITQSSQLISTQADEMEGVDAPRRKLMHMEQFKNIAARFHGDVKVAQGVPYSIAALEDIIVIGSSDGSVRVFDNTEQEIKVLAA